PAKPAWAGVNGQGPSAASPPGLTRFELVQRGPNSGRLRPLTAAVHLVGAAAPDDPVFARANPGAPGVLTHVPLSLPVAPGVTVCRVGQLRVRKNRAPQSQQDAQSTLKVVGLDGRHPTPQCA